MRSGRRFRAVLVPLIVVTLLAASCGGDDGDDSGDGDGGSREGSSAPTDEGLPDDTLVDDRTLSTGDPDHIDPATAGTPGGTQVADLIYDGLTAIDSGNDLVPAVAEEWHSDETATVWTFTLRDDVTFSDGEAVTPTTFKESWERVLDPDLASSQSYHLVPIEGAAPLAAGDAEELTGVVADDEANTLTVTLSSARADWPAIVAHTVFSPVPEAARAAEGAEEIGEWERGVMVGNGPYAMDGEWRTGEGITLVANPEHWGEPPSTERIELRISADPEAAYAAFEDGEADVAPIPTGVFDEVSEDEGSVTDPSFALYYFAIAWGDDELGGPENLAVRRAISMAIDRERINEEVHGGARLEATGFTPPGIPGYAEGLCGDDCTYDPDAAADLVEQWGKADSMRPIRLQFNRGGLHEEVVDIVEENLEEVGLLVEQDPRDADTYFDEMSAEGGCVMCRAGWIWDYASHLVGVDGVLTSDGIDGDNLGRLALGELDLLVAAAAAETDGEARARLLNGAEQVLFDNMGVIVVSWFRNQIVHGDRVEGVAVNGLRDVSYEEISLTGRPARGRGGGS